MITLTAEQAQQIEKSLDDIVRVFKFETGTPVEALAAIRAARAQEQAEQEPVVKYYGEKLVKGSKVFALLDRDLAPDTLLYAAPVRTKDLTPYEITALIRDGAAGGGWQGFAQRVIAKFKEKNK